MTEDRHRRALICQLAELLDQRRGRLAAEGHSKAVQNSPRHDAGGAPVRLLCSGWPDGSPDLVRSFRHAGAPPWARLLAGKSPLVTVPTLDAMPSVKRLMENSGVQEVLRGVNGQHVSALGGRVPDAAIRAVFYTALTRGLGHRRDEFDHHGNPQRPIRVHDLRHSWCTWAVNVWPITKVQAYAGIATLRPRSGTCTIKRRQRTQTWATPISTLKPPSGGVGPSLIDVAVDVRRASGRQDAAGLFNTTRTMTTSPRTLDEPLLTAAQLGELLGGIPAKTILQYARDGRLPCLHIGDMCGSTAPM